MAADYLNDRRGFRGRTLKLQLWRFGGVGCGGEVVIWWASERKPPAEAGARVPFIGGAHSGIQGPNEYYVIQ